MRQLTLDGVPVFVADGPPPMAAGLVFGVGRRDETFVHGGITHLVEHLAMRAVGRTTIESNASVDLTVTEFTASGPPDRVAAFLHAVCQALADLPTDQLAVEADVLRAEGGTVAAPPVALLLGELLGAAGAGLAASQEPALRSLDPAAVRDWTQRFFRRSNAALWLSGPVPERLALPLPDGPAPERAPQHRRVLATPAWGGMPIEEHVALGAELPPHPALGATIGILRTRLDEELRHRRGVAYSVQAHTMGIDPASRVLVVTSDVRPGHEIMSAQVVWRELHRLADQGPTPADLEEERAEVQAYMEDPRSDVDEARTSACARVTGVPARSVEEIRRDAAALTREAVREVAVALRSSALLLVPEEAELQLPDLRKLPEWSPGVVEGRVFPRKRLRGVPKDARLVVGDEGASLLLGEDRRITVLWRDAVGLVRQGPGDWLLVGREGFSFPLSEDDWRDGADAVALARAAVPMDLQVVDDDAHDDGVLLLRAPAHRVAEAVALGSYGATLLTNGEWTVVLADGDQPAEAVADDLSAVVGRGTTGLVLRRTHIDVEYVLLRGPKAVDQHRWGVSPGDPRLLAQATGRPETYTAYLLGMQGSPEELVEHAVAALGLPLEVPALLHGAGPVAGQRVEGKGIVGGFRASVRGDFVAPAGSGNAMDGWQRLSRSRPGWYRAVNALAALLTAAGVWIALTTDLPGAWRLVTGIVSAIGFLSCLWELRPPRRPDPTPASTEPEVTPTG